MSSIDLVPLAQNKQVAESPMVQDARDSVAEEHELQKQEAGKRVPAWAQSPDWLSDDGTINPLENVGDPTADQGTDTKKPGDGTVKLNPISQEDQDWLSTGQFVQQNYDLAEQQLQDENNGIKRREGSYSNQYLQPNKQMVLGYDVASGEQVFDDVPHNDKMALGLEKLRQAEMNLTDGADANGMEGASYIFQAGVEAGKTPQEIERELGKLGIPPSQIRLAAKAADEAQVEADLIGGYSQPPSAQELSEAMRDEQRPEDIPLDSLPTNQEWMSAAEVIFKGEQGRPPRSPQELNDWALESMSAFNWKLASYPGADSRSMAYFSTQAYSMGGEYARALLTMIDMYDRVPTNMGIIGENIANIAKDPTTLLGFGSGKAMGKFAQVVAKNRMKKWLQAMTQNAAVGAAEGAVYTAAEDAMRQSVEIAAGARDEYDAGQGAKAAGVGAVVGAGAGAVIGHITPYAADYMRKTGRTMRDNYKNTQTMTPMRSQYGSIMPPTTVPFAGAGADQRLGTRVPTGVSATENPVKDPLVVGIESLSRSDALEKNVAKMEAYPALRAHPDPNATTAERADFIKQQIKDNLLWLHDQMDPELRNRAKQWYTGARKQVDKWSEKYGYKPEQIAAVIAALSPQKDWFQNMSMAERVMDAWKNAQDFVPNQKMIDEGTRIYENNGPRHTWNANDRMKSAVWADIQNKKLGELTTDYERAMWIRAYDQSQNPRRHRIWSPEGDLQGFKTTDSGSESVTAWGGLDTIGSAVSALRDGSMENISRSVGEQHKVRNFYNNIVAPDSDRGEVTIDTHAVAAGLMQPHGGSATEVLDNLGGGAGSDLTGDRGTYGIYADAYREAAAERGILPREMQSITWEEVRTIFNNKSAKVKKDTLSVWNDYKSGTIDAQQAREKVYEIAEGSNPPSWAAVGPGSNGEAPGSTYAEELPGGDVPRGDTAADPGDAGRAAKVAQGERVRRDRLRRGVYLGLRPAWTGDAKARVFRGRSPGRDSEVRGVEKVFELAGGKGKTYNNTLRKSDLPTDPVINKLNSQEMAPTFQAGVAASKAQSPYGAAVHVYSPEEYAQMDLYQSPDGTSGFAIKPDGDIVSVYSGGGGNVYSMLQLAVEQGGTKLDAFDTVLPEIYEQAGFREVNRLTWDDQYAPEGWDAEVFGKYNGGKPDVVEMVYDPNYRATEMEGVPATQALEISPEAKTAWQEKQKAKVNKARETGKGRDPTVRFDKIEEAATKFEAGEITLKQFRNVVSRVDPPPIPKKVEEVPTFEDIAQAITKKVDDSGIIGLNKNIAKGEQVSSRLDIPAYRNYGVWIPTIHEPTPQGSKAGKVMGYAQAAHLTDVTFGTSPDQAIGITKGAGKHPFSTIDGKWAGEAPAKSKKEAQAIVSKMNDKGIYKDKDGNEWVQVGMNPTRSSGYYVKGEYNKLELLSGAEEVIQVGSVVIAKNPTRVPLTTKDGKPDPEARKLLGVKEGGTALFSLLAAAILMDDETTGEPEA